MTVPSTTALRNFGRVSAAGRAVSTFFYNAYTGVEIEREAQEQLRHGVPTTICR